MNTHDPVLAYSFVFYYGLVITYVVILLLFGNAAWIQVSSGNVTVRAVFSTSTGFKHAGSTIAESNCWSMLKGGLIVDESGPAQLYFEVRKYVFILNRLLKGIITKHCFSHFNK